MSETTVTKRCTKCKVFKPRSEFYKKASRPDGLRGWCKACDKAGVTSWRKTEQGAALRKKHVAKYRKTEKYIVALKKWHYSDKGLAFRQQNRDKHAEKIRAQKAIGQAVKRGTFPHASEFVCPCNEQAEHWHHYNGYDGIHRWEIAPVCRTCHVAIHKTMASNSST